MKKKAFLRTINMEGLVRYCLNKPLAGGLKKAKLAPGFLAVILTMILPCLWFWTTSKAVAQTGATPYYQGKTIILVSGHSPGGSADLWARLMARHLSRFIPGSPTVIVQNRPGKAAANKWMLEKAPNNGTVIAAIGGGPANTMIETRAFDLFKGIMIAGVETNRVMIARRSILPYGLKSLSAPTRKPIFLGTTAPTDFSEPTTLDLLGLNEGKDYKWVYGFGGTGPKHAAVERGEIDIGMYSEGAFIQLIRPEPERFAALFQYGSVKLKDGQLTIVRDSRFLDIPIIEEAYVSLYGKKPSGIMWKVMLADTMTLASNRNVYAPPGTSKEVVEILLNAWAAMVKDSEFLAEQNKVLGTDTIIHHVGRHETEARLREIVRLLTDAEVKGWIAAKVKK